MASAYALAHLKSTIPLAVLLTLISCLILNRTHLLKVAAVVLTIFSAALTWNVYLINAGIWTYPPQAITGARLMGIPVAELFVFFVQTYITSLIYIFCNITVVHAKYLKTQWNPPTWIRQTKLAVQVYLAALTVLSARALHRGDRSGYMSSIITWIAPIALSIWTVAGRFILSLPGSGTVVPILISTAYQLLFDGLESGKGTWTIGNESKLRLYLFGSLEIEDAYFFLCTNMLVVFGLAAVDQYLAVIDAFPHLFPEAPTVPTLRMLLKVFFTGTKEYDTERIQGIWEADDRLRAKSRSFHLASFAFSGRMRIDLILLYSFCRMADDLIDNATSEEEIKSWSSKLIRYFDLFYDGNDVHRREVDWVKVNRLVDTEFPASARSALRFLPTRILPGRPFYGLIEGFRMDAQFNIAQKDDPSARFPIKDEAALWKYSNCVAGTIGQLCNALIVHHCRYAPPNHIQYQLGLTAMSMGIALQLVNIARDIPTDAKMGRVYLPTTWLRDRGLTPEDIIKHPDGETIRQLRQRVLNTAFTIYGEMRPVMEHLPNEARGPMILVVESYMEIGRVLRESYGWTMEQGKATVPARRRLMMAVKTLLSS